MQDMLARQCSKPAWRGVVAAAAGLPKVLRAMRPLRAFGPAGPPPAHPTSSARWPAPGRGPGWIAGGLSGTKTTTTTSTTCDGAGRTSRDGAGRSGTDRGPTPHVPNLPPNTRTLDAGRHAYGSAVSAAPLGPQGAARVLRVGRRDVWVAALQDVVQQKASTYRPVPALVAVEDHRQRDLVIARFVVSREEAPGRAVKPTMKASILRHRQRDGGGANPLCQLEPPGS